MVRILSILPALMGTICIIILGASLYGYSPPDSGMEVPIVPCPEGSSGCIVGMTDEDLSVPGAFILLDIRLSLEWAEPDRSWIAVVDADAEKECPPDANGLTTCTEEDIESFIISGGPESDGSLEFRLEPGKYRFVTAGKEGSGLDSQTATMGTTIQLSGYVEIALGLLAILLFAGAGEMAFPVRNIIGRLRKS